MSEDFIAHLHDLFASQGRLLARRMFGGHGLYLDGLFFAIVIDEALYLKVDAETAPDFAAAGCAPFVYVAKGKSIPMSYWSVPAEAMESPGAMRPWAERALGAALRKANAPKKPRARRKVPPKV